MKCPNCNSENVSFISNTQKRGFSVADACCGWLLFNWIGVLCGAIGANKTKTQDYWVCNNCGRKFQAKQMQKYNKQFINQETSTPQIEEKTEQEQQSPIAVCSITDPKTYVERTASYSGNLSVEALLKRAMLYLEDGEWEKAYEYAENALDVDAECAEAYLAKFLAEYNINSADDIPSECEEMLVEIESLTELTSYGKAMRFADDELKAKLEGYNNETIYRFAANLQDKSGFGTDIPAQLKETIRLFRSISGYKDADEKAEKCKEKIRIYENGVNRENYKKACDYLKEAEKGGEYQAANYINAVRLFKECGNYSDAVEKYNECKEIMYNMADTLSNEPKSVNDVDTAIMLFQNVFGYKDSAARSNELEETRGEMAKIIYKKVLNERINVVKKWISEHKKTSIAIATAVAVIILCIIFIPLINNAIKMDQAAEYYNEALGYYENGDYASAVESMENAVKLYNDEHYSERWNYYIDCVQAEKYRLSGESLSYSVTANFISPEHKLEFADKKFSEGDYEWAMKVYDLLCRDDEYSKAKYAYASQLYDNGNYAYAIKYFEELGDYSDSAERIKKYNDEKESLEKEEKYISAIDAMNDGEYLSALSEFKKISGYKDSDEKYKECAYAYATEQYDLGKYKNAEYYFEMLGDYKDSQEKFKITSELADEESENNKLYKEASDLLGYNRYLEAAEIYKSLGDYKDSAEKAKEAEKLYQDSLPKTIDGAAEEVKSKFNFDGGVLEYSGYTYYRVIDGYLDIYNNIGNFNLILEEGSTVELDIEKGLSKLTVSPEVDNATFYSTYPSMVLDEYSYTSYYDYRVYSVALVDKYLFVTSEYTCNNTGAWDLSWIIPEYKTIIFDTVTGKEVQLDEIADTSKLKDYAYEYAVNDVYNSSYDATYNWKENLYYDTWYEDDECWSVSDGSLEVIYNNIIEGMSYYECRVCVHIPINIFKSCFY